MRLLPRTAFSRAALAIALLLFLAQLLMVLPLRALMFGPAADQLAGLVADRALLVEHLASGNAAPSTMTGEALRLHAGPGEPPGGPPTLYYQRVFGERLRERLGNQAGYRVQQDEEVVLWASTGTDADYWLGLPMREVTGGTLGILWFWIAMTLILSVVGAALLAHSLTAPLRSLADLVTRIGRGERPNAFSTGGPSEVRTLTAALAVMTEGIDEATTERELLLAGISHDLRTPLARMRLTAEWLSEADADHRDSLIEDIEDIDGILSQFIDSVRAGYNEPEELTDPTDLIEQAAARFARTGLKPALNIAPLPPLMLRPRAIARVLDNLLDNAKAHGAPPIQICAALLAPATVRISVHDAGQGLTEEEIEALFKPFARAASSDHKGTGLGLFTARRLMRLHGGELSLHRRNDTGLEARIEIPLPDDERRSMGRPAFSGVGGLE